MSRSSPQRHQHGVRKNLVEGIGGLLVGAALVLLVRDIVSRRNGRQAAPAGSGPTTQTTAGDSA